MNVALHCSLLQGLARTVPFLRELGWTSVEVHRTFIEAGQTADSDQSQSCPLADSERQASVALCAKLAIVIGKGVKHLTAHD